MPAPDLNAQKAHAVRAAKNLRYPKEIADKIWEARSEDDIAHILQTYRERTEKEEDLKKDRYLGAVHFHNRYRKGRI